MTWFCALVWPACGGSVWGCRREKKKAAMGPEPTGADLVKIMVRMPDGRKIQRSFLPSDR